MSAAPLAQAGAEAGEAAPALRPAALRGWRWWLWLASLAATVAGGSWLIARLGGGLAHLAIQVGVIRPAQWAGLAALAALYHLFDYARYYTLLRLVGFRLRLSTGIRLTCVNYFVSSLVPMVDLHLPAMIYLLRKEGLAVPLGAAATITKSAYMAMWICLVAFLSVAIQGTAGLPGFLVEHLSTYLAVLVFFLLLFLPIVLFPRRIERWLSAGRLARRFPSAAEGVRKSAQAISEIGKSRSRWHWLTHLFCAAAIVFYAGIGYWLSRILGVGIGPMRAFTAFSNSLMVAYSSPVPASMGVTEAFSNYLMHSARPEAAMAANAVLRFLCYYVLLLPGAVFWLRALREEGRGA